MKQLHVAIFNGSYSVCYNFSKLDPSRNRVAESLSERNQHRNMRTMKVNAEVTAVISCLELFGNLVCIFLFVFLDLSGYTDLFVSLSLYLLLLPYTFLMNTRDNKDRVIDDGWINVLKNTFQISSKIVMLRGNQIENIPQQKNQHPPLNKTVSSGTEMAKGSDKKDCLQKRHTFAAFSQIFTLKSSPKTENPKPSSREKNDDNDAIQIYTIFENQQLGSNLNENTIKVPADEHPCSSKIDAKDIDHALGSDGDESPLGSTLLYIRSDIISEMLLHIFDENLYIEHCKRFVSFEEALKRGESILNVLGNEYLRQIDFDPSQKWKPQDRKRNVKAKISLDKDERFHAELEHEMEVNEMETSQFVGDFKNRFEMRKVILNCLLKQHDKKEDIYCETLERFINMEESLVI